MITVSIVSHRHGAIVTNLLSDLADCAEVSHVILTCNTSEDEISIPRPLEDRVTILFNKQPKGFGANHNFAFKYCKTPFYGILNPDVRLKGNPFPALVMAMRRNDVALCAPAVLNPAGRLEDSVRRFPTLLGLIRKALKNSDGRYVFQRNDHFFFPDWVAGMFMLIRSDAYAGLKGFDEGYFLYYEDVDLCARIWQSGKKILICPETAVIHDARRASRHNLRHLLWHLGSMGRYFTKAYWNFSR